MTTKHPDAKTELLVAQVAQTRARVESDVEALAGELRPARIKEKAIDAAEQEAERFAWRALARLAQGPRALARYVRKHPVVGLGAAAGAALLTWRLVQHRR